MPPRPTPLAALLLAALATGGSAWAASKSALDELTGSAGTGTTAPIPGVVAGKSVEASGPAPFKDCAGADSETMAMAIPKALDKVDSCVKRLNPVIAGKIKAMMLSRRITFACGGDTGTTGGRTDHATDEKGNKTAVISIAMRKEGKVDRYAFVPRVLHELIHAVDDPLTPAYIVNAEVHARAGYPDAVYGCHLGCIPQFLGEDTEERVIKDFEKSQGKPIPSERADCSPGQDCKLANKYAYLCKLGKPLLKGAGLSAAKAKSFPACVMDQLINNCESAACKKLRKYVEEKVVETDRMAVAMGGRATGEVPGNVREELKAIGAAIEAAKNKDGCAAIADIRSKAMCLSAYNYNGGAPVKACR